MVLGEGTKGVLLMTGAVQDIITATGLKYYSGYVYLDNLVAGDSVDIIIYVNDPQAAALKIYDQWTYSGVQDVPAIFLVNVPTDDFKVTIEQTAQGAGGYKNINYVRYDS